MKYVLNQSDIDILHQSTKDIRVKIELLNHNYKVVDVLEGVLVSDSYSISAESDIRRTYTLSLFVKDSSFYIGSDKKIWMDKYIRPYISYQYLRTGEHITYLMGTFCLNTQSYNYDVSTSNLSLSCNDLMCTINGQMGGFLEGLDFKISAGANARTTIRDLLEQHGITKYLLNDLDYEIPYDMEFNVGISLYDVLKDILSLYPAREIFFDIDGTFIIQKIPTLETDDCILDNETIMPLVISESSSSSFEEVFNHIIIYGNTIETDRYSNACTYSNNVYKATFEGLTELKNFEKYTIKIPNTCSDNAKININNLGERNIVTDDYYNIKQNRIIANGVYTFRYRSVSKDFLLLGEYQVVGEAFDKNPNSPFSCDTLGYEKTKVLSGGEFEKIYTDEYANQRARYELYLSTNMQNSITLETMQIPWLDVNTKIKYKSKLIEDEYQYIIKEISGESSSCKNTIKMIRFYNEYPNII